MSSEVEEVTRYRVTLTKDQLYFFYRSIGRTSVADRVNKYNIDDEESRALSTMYRQMCIDFPDFKKREKGDSDE